MTREEACWLLVLMLVLMLMLLLCRCLPPPSLPLLCEGCGQCTPSTLRPP